MTTATRHCERNEAERGNLGEPNVGSEHVRRLRICLWMAGLFGAVYHFWLLLFFAQLSLREFLSDMWLDRLVEYGLFDSRLWWYLRPAAFFAFAALLVLSLANLRREAVRSFDRVVALILLLHFVAMVVFVWTNFFSPSGVHDLYTGPSFAVLVGEYGAAAMLFLSTALAFALGRPTWIKASLAGLAASALLLFLWSPHPDLEAFRESMERQQALAEDTGSPAEALSSRDAPPSEPPVKVREDFADVVYQVIRFPERKMFVFYAIVLVYAFYVRGRVGCKVEESRHD